VAQRKIWRFLQFAAGAALVALAVHSVAHNWQAFRNQPIDWQFRTGWIAASVVIVFLSYAVLIEAWRRVLLSMGQRLAFMPAARIWFLASLGKYVPGKVWAVAGAAVLAQRAGVDPSAAVAGALVLQALALASGVTVVALTAREAFEAVGQGATPVAAAVLGLALVGVGVLASPRLLQPINRLLPKSWPRLRAIPFSMLMTGYLANVVAWTGYGVALVFLTRGLLPDIVLSIPQAVGVFTCSYLAGFIVLFAPGGLGPRESVFLLLLSDHVGIRAAAALALASRLLLTGTEILPAIPLLLRPAATKPSSVREA